jgi:prepilin-type N-terminal cleavage/methylation domain-containing protein
MSRRRGARASIRRGFSMVELLIALVISSMLLTACLAALDSSFKAYETTADQASTHVVSRLVMHRMLAMIRTGEEFGPYPIQVLTPTSIDSESIQFVSFRNDATGERQVTRIEKQADGKDPKGNDKFVLVFKRDDYLGGVLKKSIEQPLIRNLMEAKFTLEYDVGPSLRRATIDLSILPDDTSDVAVSTDLKTPVLRLIASTTPRKLY